MQNHDQSEPKHKSDARSVLQQIIESEPGTIRAFVAEEALDYSDDDPVAMFNDLMRGGCQSGMIGSLTYYYDTHAFFDRFYDDIETVRQEIEDNLGEAVTVNGDLKNFYAWLAFEETAFRLANDDLQMEL